MMASCPGGVSSHSRSSDCSDYSTCIAVSASNTEVAAATVESAIAELTREDLELELACQRAHVLQHLPDDQSTRKPFSSLIVPKPLTRNPKP